MTVHDHDYARLIDQTTRLPLRRIAQSAALALGLTLTGLTGLSGALAQDATPASTECVAPAGPMMAAGSMASPAAGDASMASPAAADDSAEMTGTAADEALSAEVIAAANNYTACFNAGELEAAINLLTPEYRLETFGVDDVPTIVAAYSSVELPQTMILELDNVMTYPDGQVSVDAQYMTGEYQYSHSRMFFVQEGDTFYLADETPLRSEAEGDAAVKSFAIGDDTSPLAFGGAPTSPEMPVLILYGQNDGQSKHTVTLLRLPEGAAATPVAEMAMDTMMNAEFIGAVSIEPGARAELVLVGLPVGDYLLLDPMVPGSAATLTITPAE